MKINVAVIGASGYSGLELVRLLLQHPQVKLTAVTSERYAGQSMDLLFPSLLPQITMPLEALQPEKIVKKADFIFTALPHKEAMAVIPFFMQSNKKVVDLSADFRFRDRRLYEKWYQKHSAPELLASAVYGLPELNRAIIKSARLVANPGCYPTSALIPLLPLVQEGLIAPGSIIVDSKSGVSGAGRGAAVPSLFCEVSESFKAYGVAKHRHQPEIEEQLSLAAKKPLGVTFVPHLVPMNRGILSTIYADLKKPLTGDALRSVFSKYYSKEKFVRVFPEGMLPQTGWVRGSNYCDMGLVLAGKKKLILVSAIDNLVKGAAGQAVQNMNIMLGFKEDTALGQVPLYP
jgi:N-acetyl-gamma-glutamyl-phosphate reductase